MIIPYEVYKMESQWGYVQQEIGIIKEMDMHNDTQLRESFLTHTTLVLGFVGWVALHL